VQEDVEHRTATLIVNGTKFTGRMLKNAITKLMTHKKNPRQKTADVIPRGKQTVKQLVGQNQGVSNIEIKDEGVKDFERVARKYGVDFAVKKIKGKAGEKSTYMVFFKARDADALTSAFREFSTRKVKKAQRPSVLAQLRSKKPLDKAKTANRVKNKVKENVR
jgi:hypothetical protein